MRRTILSILIVAPFFSLQLFAQNEGEQEIVPMESPEPDEYYSIETNYNSDGTYVKRRKNGTILEKGFHVNKQLEGELTIYNNLGSISKIEHYKKGKLDGTSQEIYDTLITIKQYSQGNQIDYETVVSTRDLTHPISKMGPFFTGEKKSHSFAIYKEIPTDESIGYFFDTLTLSSQNQPILKRLVIQKKTNTNKIDTLFIAKCIFLNDAKESYSVNNLNDIIHKSVVSSMDLGFRTPFLGTDVTAYYTDGKIKWHITPSLRLTYYPNGQINDSIAISSDQANYFYRFLENGELLFFSNATFDRTTNSTTRNFEYYDKKQPLYTISSINNRPERVTSKNDSILNSIQKGDFIDYYGTHYITQADGKIDTSYSKERFPYHYTNDLPQGTFYISTEGREIKKLTIDQNGVFITSIFLGSTTPQITKKQTIIYKIDDVHHIYESATSNYKKTKLCINSKSLFSYDYVIKKESSDWNEEDLFLSTLADTIGLTFKTPLFTEEDYQKALKLAPITSVKKSMMEKCLKENYKLRKELNDYKNQLYSKKIDFRYQSGKLRWIFYQNGINPFFSEKELNDTIKSYELTDEEKKEFKKMMLF
jgi:antitoxin component YwqK of YwqJK toxin-antitoxin module